ncbi:hypothetical protein [Polaromonas sp. SM01]|uniref:hypothetical protein n=1 Tax=Polaromonas sp. SM01 TaxID=3085630 RepID=UPI002980ED02|nr:hypothetical protein [Polaromonas sp. SM01]MDW5441281.1 hypothetical protein [Polaromonas sp. SM01]
MARFFKWGAGLILAALLIVGVVALALHSWVGSDDFRQRMEREASAALGLPVLLGGIEVALWPLPAVAVRDLRVLSQPTLTLARVEVRPGWSALLRGRLEIATLVLRQAVLPQQAVDAIFLSLQKNKQATPATFGSEAGKAHNAKVDSEVAVSDWLPRRAVLEGVRWVSLKGASTTLDAEVRLGTDSLPDDATLKVVQGHLNGLQARLQREEAGQWGLHVTVGGGTVAGRIGLQQQPAAQGGPMLVVQGQLETRGVEVAALTAPNKPLSGRLEASTTLNAKAATTVALVDALQTQTRFTVKDAVLHGLDLVKAVQTVGLNRGGQTRLDTLAGQLHSQGRALQLSNLVASSGALSATGNVAVSPAKTLSGRLSVNLAGDSKLGQALGGAVGVPLMVSGTLDAPEVTLTRGALLGAAIGTAVMPGAGTGAGLQLGDRLGQGLKKLFGK